jgi:cytidylate kinase
MAILTLTGELGSGRKVVGEAAAALLDYQCISRQNILADLDELGNRWAEWGKEFDAHCPTIWERYDWSYMTFKAQIQAAYLSHALRDKVVLIGRGGNFLLKEIPYVLRALITAPREVRVERIMKKEEISREAAEWLIDKTDSDSSCYINSLYGKKWNDPAEYDLVLDTSSEPVNAIVKSLKNALLNKERFNTKEAREVLRVNAEAARVKAALFTNPHTFVPTLDVVAVDGGILVRGVIHNPAEQKKIEDAARALAGKTAVRFELHYR